jgi:hypothetical protein
MPRALSATTCVALLACSACSSTTEPVDPVLSGTTALRAANVFTSLSMGSGAFQTAATANDPAAFTCPRGGSFKNTIDATGETIRASLIYVGCGVADSAGQVWTFTTLPKLSITLTPVRTDSSLVTTSTLTGGLRVESSGVRGSCYIDNRVRVETSLTAPVTLRIRQSGQICGQTIDTTWTATLPAN